ncbi:MAG TPA: Gldg family protein, partial [Planctomycetota bacterium]|nr:Gldg family protein [Planctomycetota bacterium]
MTVLGKPRQSGRGTRWWIALQVALSVGLAVVAVQLINYLVARPGIRVRFDTTAKETNSLDPAMTRVLEQLPEDENVTVDIFFRPVHPPLARLVSQVQDRTSQLLERMALVSAGRLRIRRNDMADFTAVQQRLLDLRLRGLENCVVVSKGEQREVVRLIDGLATFDPGNPNPDAYRPPAIRSFDAEINLLKGILSVTRGERPHVYFTTGHGEADPFEEGAETAGVLETALREDGFVIHTWNPAEDGDLPEDAFVVAVVGPIDPLGEATQNRLTRFLNGSARFRPTGGR